MDFSSQKTPYQGVQLWDVTTGQALYALSLPRRHGGVTAVAFSLNGDLLATGSRSNDLQLWDAYTGELRRTFQKFTHGIKSVGFSRDGGTLTAVSGDGTQRTWDVPTGELLETSQSLRYGNLLAWSKDRKSLAVSVEGNVRLVHPHNGLDVITLPWRTSKVAALRFAHDGKTLATGSADGTVEFWYTTTLDTEGHVSLAQASIKEEGDTTTRQFPFPKPDDSVSTRSTQPIEWEDKFENQVLDGTKWRIGRAVVNAERGGVVLRDRGYLVSAQEFPSGVVIQLAWSWNNVSSYPDHLAIVLRTSGHAAQQRPYEAVDGVVIKFDPDAKCIRVAVDGQVVGRITDISMPPRTLHQIGVSDDGKQITVYFNDATKAVLNCEVQSTSAKHHFAIYNREMVAGSHESRIGSVSVRKLTEPP